MLPFSPWQHLLIIKISVCRFYYKTHLNYGKRCLAALLLSFWHFSTQNLHFHSLLKNLANARIIENKAKFSNNMFPLLPLIYHYQQLVELLKWHNIVNSVELLIKKSTFVFTLFSAVMNSVLVSVSQILKIIT